MTASEREKDGVTELEGYEKYDMMTSIIWLKDDEGD